MIRLADHQNNRPGKNNDNVHVSRSQLLIFYDNKIKTCKFSNAYNNNFALDWLVSCQNVIWIDGGHGPDRCPFHRCEIHKYYIIYVCLHTNKSNIIVFVPGVSENTPFYSKNVISGNILIFPSIYYKTFYWIVKMRKILF